MSRGPLCNLQAPNARLDCSGKSTTHAGVAHDLNLPTSNVIHQLAFDHISDSIPLLLNKVGKCTDLPDVVVPVSGTKSSCGIHYLQSRILCSPDRAKTPNWFSTPLG